MPLFDFKCKGCGKVSEILLRRYSEKAICPECGSNDMEKMLTSSYIVKQHVRSAGSTCCGKEERCETPPCSAGGT